MLLTGNNKWRALQYRSHMYETSVVAISALWLEMKEQTYTWHVSHPGDICRYILRWYNCKGNNTWVVLFWLIVFTWRNRLMHHREKEVRIFCRFFIETYSPRTTKRHPCYSTKRFLTLPFYLILFHRAHPLSMQMKLFCRFSSMVPILTKIFKIFCLTCRLVWL